MNPYRTRLAAAQNHVRVTRRRDPEARARALLLIVSVAVFLVLLIAS